MYGGVIGLLTMGVGQYLTISGDTPNVIIAGLGFIIIGGFIYLADVIVSKEKRAK